MCTCSPMDPACNHADPECSCPACGEEIACDANHCDECGWKLDLLAECAQSVYLAWKNSKAILETVKTERDAARADLLFAQRERELVAHWQREVDTYPRDLPHWKYLQSQLMQAQDRLVSARLEMYGSLENIRGPVEGLKSAVSNMIGFISEASEHHDVGVYVRQCAWCKDTLGLAEGSVHGGVSHGICAACSAKQLADAERLMAAITVPG